jgi:hypothetical protein
MAATSRKSAIAGCPADHAHQPRLLGGELICYRLAGVETMDDQRRCGSVPIGTVPGNRLIRVVKALRAGPEGRPIG